MKTLDSSRKQLTLSFGGLEMRKKLRNKFINILENMGKDIENI